MTDTTPIANVAHTVRILCTISALLKSRMTSGHLLPTCLITQK